MVFFLFFSFYCSWLPKQGYRGHSMGSCETSTPGRQVTPARMEPPYVWDGAKAIVGAVSLTVLAWLVWFWPNGTNANQPKHVKNYLMKNKKVKSWLHLFSFLFFSFCCIYFSFSVTLSHSLLKSLSFAIHSHMTAPFHWVSKSLYFQNHYATH